MKRFGGENIINCFPCKAFLLTACSTKKVHPPPQKKKKKQQQANRESNQKQTQNCTCIHHKFHNQYPDETNFSVGEGYVLDKFFSPYLFDLSSKNVLSKI